jgi:hypothetical protein
MNTFLDAFNQSKLNQEVIDHLSRSISGNEIVAVIESFMKEEPKTGWIHS